MNINTVAMSTSDMLLCHIRRMTLHGEIHSCAFSPLMQLLSIMYDTWSLAMNINIMHYTTFCSSIHILRFYVNNAKEQISLDKLAAHQLYLYLPTWHLWSAEPAYNHYSIQTLPCSAQGAQLHSTWWLLPAGSPALGLCREQQQLSTEHVALFKLYIYSMYCTRGVGYIKDYSVCTHKAMQSVPIHTQHFCSKKDEFHCWIISGVARYFRGNL